MANDAMATLIIMTGNRGGGPGSIANRVKEANSTMNKQAMDLAIPNLSAINPAPRAAIGFIHSLPTLSTAAMVTLIKKMSDEYDVNRNVPQ